MSVCDVNEQGRAATKENKDKKKNHQHGRLVSRVISKWITHLPSGSPLVF